MNLEEALEIVIIPGLKLLPAKMDTPSARVIMLTIGMQESRFTYRRQIRGPARGFFQFEKGGGYAGVLRHRSSKELAESILNKLHITDTEGFEALVYNDMLSASFCRLLLWTDPKPLPRLTDRPEVWWDLYLRTWRPGRPHRETWDAFLLHAKEEVLNGRTSIDT